MKQHVALHRDNFLDAFFAGREKLQHEQLWEVCLDELHMHQHCHKFDDSIWDLNNEHDLQVGKLKHKGSLHCFLCAMQGPDPREADVVDKEKLETVIPRDRGGTVPGTAWTFSPQQKSSYKGDCHKVLNLLNLLQWWKEQLLPNLHQPSITIMDNTKCHCACPEDAPKRKNACKKDWQKHLCK